MTRRAPPLEESLRVIRPGANIESASIVTFRAVARKTVLVRANN